MRPRPLVIVYGLARKNLVAMMSNLFSRPANLVIAVVCLLAILFAMTLATAARDRSERWRAGRQLVEELGLTDLCLVTEARYTRHWSLADGHAPFQDHPLALEHFPSGALLPPPPHFNVYAPLDR